MAANHRNGTGAKAHQRADPHHVGQPHRQKVVRISAITRLRNTSMDLPPLLSTFRFAWKPTKVRRKYHADFFQDIIKCKLHNAGHIAHAGEHGKQHAAHNGRRDAELSSRLHFLRKNFPNISTTTAMARVWYISSSMIMLRPPCCHAVLLIIRRRAPASAGTPILSARHSSKGRPSSACRVSRPVIQRLGQCFYGVFQNFITCQQHGLDPNGRHILVLAIVAARRDHALAVRRISGQQTGRCAAIYRQQDNAAAVGQLLNHLGLYAGRTNSASFTALQLLGRVGKFQVDLLDHFVQAISRQNLFGVLLRAGFFANADGLALQLLHGVDAGICPHNNMAFFLIQYRHGAEVIFSSDSAKAPVWL